VSSTDAKNDARLNFRLASVLKQEIEEAAAQMGQSVSAFAISALLEAARNVIQQQSATKLTSRDRDLFVSLLDAADKKPNKALTAAAKKCRRNVG
jgi:uncharacterized protein (DUF1778 family)